MNIDPKTSELQGLVAELHKLSKESESVELQDATKEQRHAIQCEVQQNSGKSATWYQPHARMLKNHAGLSSNPRALSSNLAALSSNLERLSSNPEALSSNPHGVSRDLSLLDKALATLKNRARQILLASLSCDPGAHVDAQALRCPSDVMPDFVLDVLPKRPSWLSGDDCLLCHNSQHIRQKDVQPLLQAGRIAAAWSDRANDPEQTYRVSEGLACRL